MNIKNSKLKILHCPMGVGGNPQALAREERKQGAQSHCVVFLSNKYNYKADEILYTNETSHILREIKKIKLLIRAMLQYDVIHYNFGKSIFSAPPTSKRYSLSFFCKQIYANLFYLLDVKILKLLNKKICVTFQGDDARQGLFLKSNYEISPFFDVKDGYYTTESDYQKIKLIEFWDKKADYIFALNPDIMNVLPKRTIFLPYCHVPIASKLPSFVSSKSNILTIAHAPTNREVKGTKYIIEAVSRLKSEGFIFNFQLIENLSNSDALKQYQDCDIFIDQLLCGWYGGVSVEVMNLGKPVVCYIRESDLKHIPKKMRSELPIINATPTTIYLILKTLIQKEKKELQEIGQNSFEFIKKWHSPEKIAQTTINFYKYGNCDSPL